MRTEERDQALRVLLLERYGPYADTARERTTAEVVHLPRRRQADEQKAAA